MSEVDQSSTGTDQGGERTTSLNRRWVLKMCAFLVAMLVLGVWGAYDAFSLYPRRGLDSAEYLQMKYLEEANKTGTASLAGVKAPKTELMRLRESDPAVGVELARMRWLEALSLVRNLEKIEAQLAAGEAVDPGPDTSMPNGSAKLEELTRKWSSQNQPAALSPFDIPVQYLFTVIGLGLSMYIVFFLLKCSRTKFRYEPGSMRLTIPDGRSFVPGEIEEVDRRLWHKFFVEMKVKGLGTVKLDLLRYSPLEEWFLEMEKASPGYVPPEAEEAGAVEEEAAKEGGAASE